MNRKQLKGLVAGGVSALALAAAGQASAVDFVAGDTTFTLYGYAIGKMSYDLNENIGDATGGSFGPLTDDEYAEGYTDLDASQSRIGFQVTSDMNGDPVVTRIEGDFRGGSGVESTGVGQFRLRHAYGSWNGLLAGQTWSNYNSFVGTTAKLDFGGLAGDAGYQSRLAQFRYTVGDFSVAVEDPVSDIAFGDGSAPTGSFGEKDSLPALTARYEGSAGNAGYSIGGIVRQVEDNAEEDSVTGYGTFVAGSYDFGAVSLQGVLNYVDGAGSYLYRSGAPDAYWQDGDLETVSAWGGTVGVSVDAGPGTINLSYGRTDVDDAEEFGADEVHENAFLNYMWQPVENVTYGIEYAYYSADDMDGEKRGDANRISVAAQYVF
ncbi:DcaP family trimeric outer membrane transporter [Arhodomonas aquaeolei]|uniref:DcaP family trimeric outer membrane transporter n=1 Tax=Arhodomonas aquaeolei TaxID=2369 RepID=UPI002168F748|nr:DcaP family trimeric outer membrane transporter [Arhodomonas aquaeolei]MCS4503528.1 DcaP family trimeric outer membrane transporter [Arhodomonas aquaeolei]